MKRAIWLPGLPLLVAGAVALGAQGGQGANARPGAQRPVQSPADVMALRVLEAGDDFAQGAARLNAQGLTRPEPAQTLEAKYTADAMRAKIWGEAYVDVIVDPDGRVRKARIAKSLDKTFGLDEQAVTAARAWVFAPGTLDGKAVPVFMTLAFEFWLH